MRVLIIEDSVFYQNVFENFFKKNNIEHLICEHGSYALEALSTEIFDIVFLDLKLPDYNGKDLYLEIIETQDITVIPITGYEKEFMESHEFFSSFDDYIIKPFDDDEILACLDQNALLSKDTQLTTVENTSKQSRTDLIDFCNTVGTKLSNQLFDEFIRTVNTKIPVLPSLYKQGHYFEIENTVHQLKANCRYFGFYEFADVCELIERQIVIDPSKLIQERLDSLLDMTNDMHQTIDWARAELQKMKPMRAKKLHL